jgi:hypothetical protein
MAVISDLFGHAASRDTDAIREKKVCMRRRWARRESITAFQTAAFYP